MNNKMDDMVFESSDDRLESPLAGHKTKLGHGSSHNVVQQTNHIAAKDFGVSSKENGISPTRKNMLNKKLDPQIRSKPQTTSQGKAAMTTELSPQALGKNKDLQTTVGSQQRHAMNDVKDLGVVGGKKRTDQNDSQSAINLNSQKEDSFQKLYSKELDLDEDEVPIILHELNDSAIHFISHEQYERSLSLLQKAQTLLDRLKFQKNPKDRFLIQVTMHNMALCFQKMGALEECALCLDACLHQINSQYLAPTFSKKPTKKLKKLKYECKIHMQVCALLSQLHRHEEALLHAKQAVQISQYLVNDLVSLCELNVEKTIAAKRNEQTVHEEQERQKIEGHSISQTSSQADLIYYDHSISMLERTALRVYPIIKEIQNRMVKHKEMTGQDKSKNNTTQNESDKTLDLSMTEGQSLNMKVLLGYLNQSEWLYLLNIGNIMQITPLTIHDLYSNQKIDVELSRDSILEKVTFLAISYFCVSTELRFLVSSKEKLSFDPVYVKAESEFWHGKALEISCGFLPSESPLVTHILSSYQKHHAPVQQAIPENEEEDQGLRVIRPEKGIDKSQFQPIVRLNKHLNIALSPLRLSPNNHRLIKQQAKAKKAEVKEASVNVNLVSTHSSHNNLSATNPNHSQISLQQQQAAAAQQRLKQQQNQQYSSLKDEQAQLLLQAAASQMHNHPSKRSIEFSNNHGISNNGGATGNQQDGTKSNLIKNGAQVSDNHEGSVGHTNNQNAVSGGQQQQSGPDIVEYELQSFDQSDIQTQGPKIVPSQNNNNGASNHAAHQRDHNQTKPQSTTTPNRQTDQNQNNNKIQMAVPSPNALASAMQKEQRESLSQSSLQERPNGRQLARDSTNASKNNHHTQRQVQNDVDRFPQDRQSASFQNLPANSSKLLIDQTSDSFSHSKQHESIDEEELIKLASDGGIKNQNQSQDGAYLTHTNRVIQSSGTPDTDKTMDNQQDTNFELVKRPQRQAGAKGQEHSHAQVFQKTASSNRVVPVGQLQQQQLQQQQFIQSDQRSSAMEERTPTLPKTDHSARLSSNANGQSQRSRSKGKLSKKKGAMTQPQTHQNSANNTAFDPLRQAKEISQFSSGGDKNKQLRQHNHTEGDEEFNLGQKVRPTHGKLASYKGGLSQAQQSKTVQANRTTTGSLENRNADSVNNHRPPSSQGLKLERPDSRRLIGGKRRQIKDQPKQNNTTETAGITAVRSSSAGRRNQQNQVISMQGYKTNDQSMTSASSHVQFTMSNAQANGPSSNHNNFKTYQQTRKAVTAHSTQASNSPRKPLPQSKFSESSNVVRHSKQAHGVQDPVFMNTNQLNQSRSTIENNNSTLIDRSMNDQLMLNNSSFEVGTAQSRSRSFAKTGALSQQNSRDVIVGSKKKNMQSHAGQSNQSNSKSQTKQKAASKEMLTYLNQGTTAQKSMNNLIAAQQQNQKYSSGQAHTQIEIDYRKQLLIKQALDMQNQTKDSHQNPSRQKSGAAGKIASGRTQMAFQTHTSSVQMPLNHTSSIGQAKQQSRSSHGLRKSSQGIQKEQSQHQVNSGNNTTVGGNGQIVQSQKILSSANGGAQLQLNNLDPQALAALSQALNSKSNTMANNPQQNAQQIYNQLVQFNQTNQVSAPQGGSQKKQQNTHTMIKKFLKERATPQPSQIPSSQSGMILGQSHANQSRSGHSLSPNPGPQVLNQSQQKHSTTLIDNFTQAPFLASSTSVVPQGKQAHTTKAAASSSSQNDKQLQPRSFNPSKIYSQKQTSKQSSSNQQQQQSQNSNSYFSEQQPVVTRKNAADRFNQNVPTNENGQQREPTPVFHHMPYQKPEDPMLVDAQNQYPMQNTQSKNSNSAKNQLAAMYKSIKGNEGAGTKKHNHHQ